MTGFDGINVQHGRLDAGSQDVMTAAKDIQSRLDQLEGDLKPLASDWTGAAKQAYDEAKATWDRAIADMIVLLQQASANVSTSNDEYKAADSRGANRF
jgi:WXG100 family type VII secretion target